MSLFWLWRVAGCKPLLVSFRPPGLTQLLPEITLLRQEKQRTCLLQRLPVQGQPAHRRTEKWRRSRKLLRLAGKGQSVQAFPNSADAGKFRFKSDVDLVVVEATVRDHNGGIINNLSRDNFHVYENGVEQQIGYFSRDALPLAVALVLDCSGSMGPVLKQMHHVAFDTLSALKPDDQVALFDFAARAELLVGLTRNRQRIADAINLIRPGGGTVIPDALFEASLYLARTAPGRRHAIILVSDNENTLKGYTDESRVIHQALESEAVIYSIRVTEGVHPHSMYVLLPIYREVSVPRITHETGGEVIDASTVASIGPALATAVSRLKQRYSLGYYSTNRRHDGAFREVEIRISDASSDPKQKYTVYSRRGYYAFD